MSNKAFREIPTVSYYDAEDVKHQHTWDTVTVWDHHSARYSDRLDYSVALEVMCSGCMERKALEQKEDE